MKSKGNYIEIAGGTIVDKYEEDYNIFTGGHLKFDAAKSVNQTGAGSGVSFNAPEMPPVRTEETEHSDQQAEFLNQDYRTEDTGVNY